MKFSLLLLLGLLAVPVSGAAQIRTTEHVCREKWPNSYVMLDYCIQRENEAAKRMGSRKYFVERGIMNLCQSRWPDSWVMLEYCVDQEEQALGRILRR